MRLTSGERGDTIIEVMFAFVVFAFVSVLTFSIMNSGVAISQRALELTQVRVQMDAQSNALRYIHQQRVADQDATNEWGKVLAKTVTSASDFNNMTLGVSCRPFSAGQRPFILNARTGRMHSVTPAMSTSSGTLPPYSQLVYNSDNSIASAYGIWIEAVRGSSTTGFQDYVDFHIRACWQTIGSSVPATIGTIVRLYDPAS